MPDDPVPALLDRINQNITALGCAMDEIGRCVSGPAAATHR
ncbi:MULTISPECIES: hypothetical protein [unclassified Pseudomonas]|nr:hypothetical protein [Pseudomonas sp. B21-015]